MIDAAKIHILLVEDNPTDSLIVTEELANQSYERFSVVHVEQLKEALALLKEQRFDVVLLDLSLPDSHGFETFTLLHKAASEIPIIVLSGQDDEELAVKAVQSGAQDYLVKGRMAEDVLPRSIRYAIERQRAADDLLASHVQLANVNETLRTEVVWHEHTELALRESEGKFRQIAENISEVFWLKDVQKVQGEMLYVSPGYERIWGRSCQELYDSPSIWSETIHPDDRKRVQDSTARQIAGTYDEQYRIIRPDLTERWIRDRAFPVTGEDGTVRRVVGVAEDITEHTLLEAQLQQAQKMEAIGTLAGGIAHDFNNILGAILGNVELAMQDLDHDHPAWKSLTEIEKAGERAKNLVQQILTFSQQNQQKRLLIPLAPVIEEAVSLLRSTLPAGVELINSVTTNGTNIMGDSTQIHQILVNLCTNARHSMEGKSGRIEIRLEQVTLDGKQTAVLNGIRSGRYACLSVSDTGKGMDDLTLKHIFEPFFTTKPIGQGTGLGLSTVHGIVKNHAGAITVVSQLGEGTTFHLYFPLVQEVAEEHLSSKKPQIPLGHGERILYLDDEEPLVNLAKRLLERFGYQVTAFTRAEDCLKAFRESPNQFDVVITDFNMPGFSGLQVAGEMLKVRPDLPIILSSGYVTEDLKESARRIGIRHVIYKPSTFEELSEIISRFAAESPQSLLSVS